MSGQPPIRRFFVIKRLAFGVTGERYFDVRLGMWWTSIGNATHFCAPTRALSYVDEFGLTDGLYGPQTVIQCIAEHTTPDTQIDDDGDPEHGEGWKK